MTFSPEQTAALSAPLHKAHVKQRKAGNGMSLSYVEAWWAIAEANRIFGFDGWTRETVDLTEITPSREVDGKWRVGYRAKVRITVFPGVGEFGDTGLIREGCGFGSGIDRDLHQAHESALKEAESDAMKRALMTFGNPFGLALYDKTQAQVTNASPPPYNPDNPPPSVSAITPSEGRKSSAQAKRDGDDATIKADIAKCDHEGLKDWHANFESYTAHVPLSWLDSIRDMLEHRLEELNGAERVAEAAGEYDEAFRASVGSGGARSVAGNNGRVAA
jgi:DNA recombination protein Rad52